MIYPVKHSIKTKNGWDTRIIPVEEFRAEEIITDSWAPGQGQRPMQGGLLNKNVTMKYFEHCPDADYISDGHSWPTCLSGFTKI